MTGALRHAITAAVLVAAAVATSAAGAGVAGADAPTTTVTPQTVADGLTVTITTTGIADEDISIYGFFQCSDDIVGWTQMDDIGYFCRTLAPVGVGGPLPPTVSATVSERFTPSAGVPIDCGTGPGACVVGVTVGLSSGDTYNGWVPVTFDPGPDLSVRRNLVDGAPVTVTAPGLAGAGATVAQCAVDHVSDPDPARRDSLCGTAVSLADTGGDAGGSLTVHDPLTTADGSTVTCGYRGCVVAVATGDDPLRSFGAISFGPPSLVVDPGPYVRGDAPEVTLAGMPGDTARVRQCATGTTSCTEGTDVELTVLGAGQVTFGPRREYVDTAGGLVDCLAVACSIVAEVDGVAVAAAPVTFLADPAVTVSPGTGLLDGQPVTVSVVGLRPGVAYDVARCADIQGEGAGCETVATVVADAAGEATAEATVVRRPGGAVVCRDQCGFGVRSPINWTAGTYTMAAGSVAATPADGLVDGQQVALTGTDLMPSYDGRSFGPFPTGGWYATQCEAAAIAQPSLWAAFDGCAAVPGTHLVSVPGSTFAGQLTVQATMTTILGRTVDCTVPGVCVVGLYRFEQDGSSTFVTTPVEFAS